MKRPGPVAKVLLWIAGILALLILGIVALGAFIVGRLPGKESAPHAAPHPVTVPASAEPILQLENHPALPLSLNEGKKWQTDDHTRSSIRRMKQLVETAPPETLGRALSGEINQLFEGCTMEGEAHNQLHMFLGEFLAHVTGLYASESQEERSEEIDAINRLFSQYGHYFE